MTALSAPAPPGLADDAGDAKSIDRWIGDLRSDSFIQRDFAMRELRRQGAAIVPRLEGIVRGDNEAAATAAVQLIGQLALADDAAAAAAHRALAALHGDGSALDELLAGQVQAALRRADRRVVGIVTALGGSIERDRELNITSLQIKDARFGDEQAFILARVASLKQLHLRETSVTDRSLTSIATLPTLEFLNLSDTGVTASGLRELAPLTSLKELVLYRIGISAEDRRWFAEHLPDCVLKPESQ